MSKVIFNTTGARHWKKHESSHGILWLAGYVYGKLPQDLLQQLSSASDDSALSSLLRDLDGHYALVAELPDRTIAAVDRMRTIPLTFGQDGSGGWHIDQIGGRLAAALGLTEINKDGALALAMAGYTIGNDTLFKGLSALAAGEAVVFDPAPRPIRYDVYRAWQVVERAEAVLTQELGAVTLKVFKKLVERAGGRPIVIPLSAGLDSRVIASGLKHLGCDNVRCFSYGLPGNYEAVAAETIAKRLGYEWRFVPFSNAGMRAFFRSCEHDAYLAYADSAVSSPFEQDLFAVLRLKEDGYIAPDAIMVNGNSGDFISGAHIQKPMHHPRVDLDEAARRKLVVDTLVHKHFRLWDALATAANDARLAGRLEQELDCLQPSFDADGLHGVYESLECRDRQSKYVISGQRGYEYAGLEWALPLWDNDFLDFWQGVPLTSKVSQRLYRETLIDLDWGGVWGPDWWWKRTVSPRWLRPIRLGLKALHAPLGRARWHKFERRYLSYWMEVMAGQAVIPYRQVAMDPRGARHSVAWHCEAYLESKGISLAEMG